MNDFLKFSIYIITILVVLFFSIWIFNHVNPWIGIAIPVIVLLFLGSKLFNKINKQK